MFLPDSEVAAMSGISQDKHKPVKLKNWLKANGYTLGVDCFRRVDGWYSVMTPQARTIAEPDERPKVRQRA